MGSGRGWVWRIALLVAWVALLIWALVYGPDLATVRAWTDGAGAAGALVYLGAYALAVQALVPRPALNIAGGLLFGIPLGVALALIGGVLAALAQFAVARHVAGDALAARLPRRVRVRLEGLTSWRAFLVVLQLRLVPVVPYQMVNYGCGLTGVALAPFAAATALGSLPATVAMVLVGAGGADLGLEVAVATGVMAGLIALVWWLVRARRRPRAAWRARA
ncbi:TVP38/TMEM64 family protein [Nocardiopsis alba]|uniref:TVP38/TMEM64 family membrane protein n=1 Tax=Nocardiopsis alba TaxID=53437 RepID=A0A7K2ILQ9_9ACTN|nr:VTT domain-containing protein [Nocardiopsis alba]MYR30908.1 TVP38/TMEM64 family protein [Nocardiopsis alba]